MASVRARVLTFAAVAAMLGAGVVATGCSTLGRAVFKQPVIRLQDVKVTGLGISGGSLDVVLDVENPNSFALDASRLTYRVLVDTVPFATGVADQRFVVDGKARQPVHIPINFTYAGVGQASRSLLATGSVNYTVSGDVTVSTPIGNHTIPYSQTGRFSTLSGSTR